MHKAGGYGMSPSVACGIRTSAEPRSPEPAADTSARNPVPAPEGCRESFRTDAGHHDRTWPPYPDLVKTVVGVHCAFGVKVEIARSKRAARRDKWLDELSPRSPQPGFR
jgi:hypothetical protein